MTSRRHLAQGWLALLLAALGLGLWGTQAEIAGAVVAPGRFVVEGNRQVVQHPTGGVIEAIHVRDGDVVAAGDVLIELDGAELATELGIVEGQWLEMLARRSRLIAERDGLAAVAFLPELEARAGDPAVAALMSAQAQQFAARARVHNDGLGQLAERQAQIADQIAGLEALDASTARQIALVAHEAGGQEQLLARGLTELGRVSALQRELARLEGTAGQIAAGISESRGRIVESEIARVRLVSERQEAAIAELRDVEFREIELRERRRALLKGIAELKLLAPADGTVYASTADTLRAVIRPAEPILYIVPRHAALVLRAAVEAASIDQVRMGQPVVVRFSAFDHRTTPEGAGTVAAVSADAIEDPETGASHYRVDIRLDASALAALGELDLVPGMPAEAFIQTGARSPLSYLVKPLGDHMARAFRER